MNFDIFWLNRCDPDSYKLRGGGMLIATKNSLNATRITIVSSNVEQICITIKVVSDLIVIESVYLPPGSEHVLLTAHCNVLVNIFYYFFF